jgi:hypothetical protein
MRTALVRAVAICGFALSTAAANADIIGCDNGVASFGHGLSLDAFLKDAPANSAIHSAQLIRGTSLTVNSLTTSGAGMVTVKLADMKWPEAFSSLSFLITDLNGTWQRLDGAGTLTFAVSGPTQLFAAVFADSSGNSRHFGLYNLDVTFAPVPLPAAIVLLVSGLGGLGAFARRKPRV